MAGQNIRGAYESGDRLALDGAGWLGDVHRCECGFAMG